MRTALLLAAIIAPAGAMACDWKIVSDKVDSMTDERRCIISSEAAKIAVVAQGKRVFFITTSAYKNGRDRLAIRVDDQPAILLDPQRDISSAGSPTNRAIDQIRAGSRIRTSYSDYPSNKEGDAAICDLPRLMDSCLSN